MKSKIYSSRYMKVTSKGLVWIPAFVTIGFLLAFPVAELIMLGNWFGMEYTAREINALYVNLWQNGFMITGLAVAALAALFNGISQFWYLYSLRKIDFYHSLPVKRKQDVLVQDFAVTFIFFGAVSGDGIFCHLYRGDERIFQSSSYETGVPYDGISSDVVFTDVFFCCAGDLHYRASAYGSAASGGCCSLWTSAFCAVGFI